MGGGSPHDVFKALGPAEWGKDLKADSQDSVRDFMITTFTEAQTVIDSIPVATGAVTTQAKTGRPRAATDSSTVPPTLPGRAPQTSDRAKTLRKDWKEVKVNPSENALGINVYKMSGKDGKGAWFARRSLHEGLSFERWKLGMEREFAETMKVKKDPGSGNIRGIGAERCVENIIVDGCGKAKVYQLSAQFPGPTTPRDFVTLMLTSDSAIEAPPAQDGQKQARYFMVVSKPCVHPDALERNGFIRGYYESVEFIREIKVGKPLRRTKSSIDMSRDDVRETALREETINRSARQAALAASASDVGDSGRSRGKTITFAGTEDAEDANFGGDDQETVIEWLMVTRSDPGGSVPRFMVERGTPAGICGDANKFLKWVSSKNLEDFDEADELDSKFKGDAKSAEEMAQTRHLTTTEPTSNILETVPPLPKRPASMQRSHSKRATATTTIDEGDESPEPQGFYGVIANALGVVASHLPNPFSGSTKGEDTEPSSSASSLSDETSSLNSFHSADEDEEHNEGGVDSATTNLTRVASGSEKVSVHSAETASLAGAAGVVSSNSSISREKNNKNISQHEKDLLKLESRRRKMEEKHARGLAKRADDTSKDESAITKLKEKHERDKARQEEKYQRELRKIEQRRENEEKKAKRRQQKAAEKQEKSDLAMEMERVKAERDVALKQIEILKEQVGDLQSQNTLLVARLGREGIPIELAKGGKGIESIFGDLGPERRKPVGSGARTGENTSAGSEGKDGAVQIEGPACLREPVKGEA